MFKSMNIKKKLIVAFVVILALTSISGITSVFITSSVNSRYSAAIKNYGFAQGDIGKLMTCISSINTSVHDSVSYLDDASLKEAQQTYSTQIGRIDELFDNVEITLQTQTTKNFFSNAKSTWEKYRPLAEQLMTEGNTNDSATILQVQQKLAAQLNPLYDELDDSLTAIMDDKVNSGNALEVELSRSIMLSVAFIIFMIVVALLVCLVLGARIANGIALPIQACAKRLSDLAQGDLTSPVPSYDGQDETGLLSRSTREIVEGLMDIIKDEKYLLEEMGHGNFDLHTTCEERYVGDFQAILLAIRTINTNLSNTLSQININSEQVSNGSDQVSSAAQNLSQGAVEQASAVEELATTISEISVQIGSNAENAVTASEKAREVGDEMEISKQEMERMIAAMNEINASSQEISKIIKTIEDIAFQTNILALNAAVEAARAGSAGKGFAVVADEVRNLASKSAEASKSTSDLIVASTKAVTNGMQIADKTAQSLLGAVDGVRQVVDIVNKISDASREQSDSVEQVTHNVDQISGVVQTNSATAQECAATSEELNSQAQMLKTLVGRFKLKVMGLDDHVEVPASSDSYSSFDYGDSKY
ncbi:MAG: methyl-accepting chemotaxis protein [Provencibacterium sp.]|nr:methyl-accepting chemotaxis protein [Provencibacterium sp.]